MEYSKYQVALFDAYRNTNDNLGVRAVAGSGKSFSLEHLTQYIPHHLTVIAVAFNKTIADALRLRIKHPKATVRTINSFGASIISQIPGMADVQKEKTQNLAQKFFNMKSLSERKRYYKLKSPIQRLVELFRANLIFPEVLTESQVLEIADEYGIDLPQGERQFPKLVRDIYAYHMEMYRIPDYRDQVFLPIYKNLQIPVYDVGLVDESQDLDKNQAELMLRACKRLIVVGDPNQAIYHFRGAMSEAMDYLLEKAKARVLPLSICYRCPKAIVRAAKELVPEIEEDPNAPEGKITDVEYEEFRKVVQPGDYVLCRTTAPLVSECLQMIRQNKRASVKGRDIGVMLELLVDQIADSDRQSISEFNLSLNEYSATQTKRLEAAGREDRLIELGDKVSTIVTIMELVDSVGGIKKKIREIFPDEREISGTIFMTIHKAKGLENPRIFILEPQLLPHPAAKKPEQQKQERHLKYVAITRTAFDRKDPTGNPGELFWVWPKGKKPAPRVVEIKVQDEMPVTGTVALTVPDNRFQETRIVPLKPSFTVDGSDSIQDLPQELLDQAAEHEVLDPRLAAYMENAGGISPGATTEFKEPMPVQTHLICVGCGRQFDSTNEHHGFCALCRAMLKEGGQ